MPEIPTDIRKQVQQHLIEIAKLFRAPLITIIVRPSSDNASGTLVLGNDDPMAVIGAIREHVERTAKASFEQETTDG